MSDCPNVEMRDRLPDLANETLEPSVRVLVLAHLEECIACTAEIEILRTTRLILVTTTPKVNVASIVMALPSYDSLTGAERGARALPSHGPSRGLSLGRWATSSRTGWSSSWRIAAAVAVFAAGIGSYAVLGPDSTVGTDSARVVAAAPVGLALTGALADLSDDELGALAQDISQIEALPSAEIEYPGQGVNFPTILPDSVVRDLEG